MANDETPVSKPAYDLEDRTAAFAEDVIDWLKTLPRTDLTRPLIAQLIRSATSIGANYCEANDAGTKKAFRHGISVCRRETKETRYWFRVIARTLPDDCDPQRDAARALWKEADELTRIFGAIFRKSDPDA